MLEDDRSGLLPMALGAGLVQLRHRQAPCRLSDIAPVRVMAIGAVDPIFDHRVVMRQIELGVYFQMALVAGRWILAWVRDEFSTSAARGDMFAARSMA